MTRVFNEEYREVVKSKIIKTAVKNFSQKGYQGSSIDEIAQQAGMSKSTLYTYFKSKLEILKVISSKQNITENFLKTFNGHDYPEAFEEFYDMMIELEDGLKVPFELLTLSLHDDNLNKIYRNGYNEKLCAFQIFLKGQQEKGTIRDDLDINTLAQLLMALSFDISMQLVMGFNEKEIHEKWSKSVKSILEKRSEI